MKEDLKQSYCGVLCGWCKQPIPVPEIVVIMEAESNDDEQPARVFNLRCRACEKERPYRTTELVEFYGMPRMRHAARFVTAVASKLSAFGRAANS